MADGRMTGSLPLSSLMPLLLLLLPSVEPCMDTVLQNGTMADDQLHVPELTVTSSCGCCAHCHQYPECASLSFNPTTGACRLYSTVPDFTRLTVDLESTIFVRPGRSQHHEFCRMDSDCQQTDDRCLGRICTTDVTVTCRDLAETHMAPMNDVYYGSLDGVETKYYCASQNGFDGWTLMSRMSVLDNGGYVTRTQATARELNPEDPSDPNYSIMQRAEDVLRVSGVEPRFRILVVYNTDAQGFSGSLAVDQTLMPTSFTSGIVDVQDITLIGSYPLNKAILPHWLTGVPAMLYLLSDSGASIYWSLINERGKPFTSALQSRVEYFIRE